MKVDKIHGMQIPPNGCELSGAAELLPPSSLPEAASAPASC